MALSRSMFKVLVALAKSNTHMTQRQLSAASGLSLGTVNGVLHEAEDAGLIADGMLTIDGLKSLKPYEVENAIIMAAGLSSRLAPISYEKPKGLLRVRGEVLIERQLRQLQEAGVTDITVVVGYKKEYFFYLASKFGVRIKVNPQYATRNNSYTLWLVRDRLDNTYVCSSDDYFEENPFEHYVYEAYYATQYVDGPTEEWCVTTGSSDRITQVSVGGTPGQCSATRTSTVRSPQALSRFSMMPCVDPSWQTGFGKTSSAPTQTSCTWPLGAIPEPRFTSLTPLIR